MLTADLVEVRIHKGAIVPRWVDAADPDRLALAARLIETFEAARGRPRGELDAELRELTGTGTAFRFHRALAKLLTDRCTFETAAAAEPAAVREAVWAASAASWRTREEAVGDGDRQPFHFDRAAVLAAAGETLDLSAAEAEAALYADLKSEQVLTAWEPCEPGWLLDRYNVALAQGVLLRATALTVEIAGQDPRRYRALFRKIKFFQLLHRVEGDAEHGYTIRLDGPLSLFGASQRYGLQMASFLPTLLHFDRWRLSAEVLWGTRRVRRAFRLDAGAPLAPIGRLAGQWQPDEVAWLPERIAALGSDWEVAEGGELVDLGGQGVLVPDLAFRHRDTGARAFLEVLGYWNRGSVARRLELLRRHGPPNLILAVSKSLAAGEEDELGELPGEVYVYRSTPSARRIVAALDGLAARGSGRAGKAGSSGSARGRSSAR